MRMAVAVAQSIQIFGHASRARNTRMGQAQRGQRMGVAARHGRLIPAARQTPGGAVTGCQHLSVKRFDAGEMVFEKGKIRIGAGSRKAGKDMVDTEEQIFFTQVSDQGKQVAAAALEFHMMAVFDAVDAHVQLRPAGGGAGDFLAEKEVGIAAQLLSAIDGVVIRHSDQIHAPALQRFIDGARFVIALAADSRQ